MSDIRFFLDKGEKINAKDGNHNTALHYAARFNPNLAVLEYLISQGADLNARNFKGKTPLDYANTEEKKRILREAIARRSRER